jgi:hypothetical protein
LISGKFKGTATVAYSYSRETGKRERIGEIVQVDHERQKKNKYQA